MEWFYPPKNKQTNKKKKNKEKVYDKYAGNIVE